MFLTIIYKNTSACQCVLVTILLKECWSKYWVLPWGGMILKWYFFLRATVLLNHTTSSQQIVLPGVLLISRCWFMINKCVDLNQDITQNMIVISINISCASTFAKWTNTETTRHSKPHKRQCRKYYAHTYSKKKKLSYKRQNAHPTTKKQLVLEFRKTRASLNRINSFHNHIATEGTWVSVVSNSCSRTVNTMQAPPQRAVVEFTKKCITLRTYKKHPKVRCVQTRAQEVHKPRPDRSIDDDQ